MNVFQYKDYRSQNLSRKIDFMSLGLWMVQSHLKPLLLPVLIYFEKPLAVSYESTSSPWECAWGTHESDCSLFKKLATYFYFWEWRYQVNLELIFFVLGGKQSFLCRKSLNELVRVVV